VRHPCSPKAGAAPAAGGASMPGGTIVPRSTTTRRCPGCGPTTVMRYDPVQQRVWAMKRSRLVLQPSSCSSPAAKVGIERARALCTRSGCAAASSHAGSAPNGCRPAGTAPGTRWSRSSTLMDMAVPLSWNEPGSPQTRGTSMVLKQHQGVGRPDRLDPSPGVQHEPEQVARFPQGDAPPRDGRMSLVVRQEHLAELVQLSKSGLTRGRVERGAPHGVTVLLVVQDAHAPIFECR